LEAFSTSLSHPSIDGKIQRKAAHIFNAITA